MHYPMMLAAYVANHTMPGNTVVSHHSRLSVARLWGLQQHRAVAVPRYKTRLYCHWAPLHPILCLTCGCSSVCSQCTSSSVVRCCRMRYLLARLSVTRLMHSACSSSGGVMSPGRHAHCTSRQWTEGCGPSDGAVGGQMATCYTGNFACHVPMPRLWRADNPDMPQARLYIFHSRNFRDSQGIPSQLHPAPLAAPAPPLP